MLAASFILEHFRFPQACENRFFVYSGQSSMVSYKKKRERINHQPPNRK